MICFLFIPFIFSPFMFSLGAASWSILPVHSEKIYHPYNGGPRLFATTEINNWELAQLIRTWLLISGNDSVLSQDTLKKVYQRSGRNSKKYLNEKDLKEIARELDSEKLLVSRIYRHKQNFVFLSKVYYKSSSSLTDTIQTKGKNLWILIQKHLEIRFPKTVLIRTFSSLSKNTILFLLDLSGANYYAIQALTLFVKNLGSSDIGICALDASGNISSLRLGHMHSQTIQFLDSLRARGGSRYLKNFHRGLQCLESIHPKKNSPHNKKSNVKTILMVGSIPKSTKEKRRVRLLLRRFSAKSEILIVGTAALGMSNRAFWEDLAGELNQSPRPTYKDLIYRQKLGLSNGDEIYLFWKGDKILQGSSKEGYNSPQFQWRIPAKYWPGLEPGRIQRIYQNFSQNRVIASEKPKILIKETILEHILDKPQEKHWPSKTARILISLEKSNFWINMPKNSLYNPNGSFKVRTGDSYYFMLNMKPDERGVPFNNSSDFGYVFKDYLHVPRILHVNISQYLANKSKFLNRSIGGSSIYIFFAKVKRIRK